MVPKEKGTLYIVATPLGNLKDITLRALEVLKESDLIAAEDTRRTHKLLSAHDIHTPLTSYHENNKVKKTEKLLKNNEDFDYKSDEQIIRAINSLEAIEFYRQSSRNEK